MIKRYYRRQNYGLHFGEYLGIWFDTHELIKENADLLEKAAEQLYVDEVLDDHYWEAEILLSR